MLSSNISHYVHAAAALDAAGMLSEFHTTYVRGSAMRVPHRPKALGVLAASVNSKRLFPEVAGLSLKLHPSSEIVARGLGAANTFRWTNGLFDLNVRRSMARARVFHFVSGVGGLSAARAKKNGALIVCDRRATHHRHERNVVAAEAERCGVPIVHAESCFSARLEKEYELADYIIVGSEYARKTFADLGFRDLVTVNYGVDTELFYPTGRKDPGSIASLLFVGLLDVRKGVRLLAEALPHLPFPYKLTLVGSQEPYALDMLRRQGVHFESVGRQSKSELRSWYNAADMLVLPSVADAYPLVTLEAMACGAVCVVSDACGTADLIRHGKSGYIFRSGDVDALLASLIEAWEERQSSTLQLGSEARSAALGQTWAAYGERLVDWYGSLN